MQHGRVEYQHKIRLFFTRKSNIIFVLSACPSCHLILPIPTCPPDPTEASVQEVVGTTFEQEVLKNANDVVLCFYSPWGEHSDYFHPIYEELAAQVRKKGAETDEMRGRPCIFMSQTKCILSSTTTQHNVHMLGSIIRQINLVCVREWVLLSPSAPTHPPTLHLMNHSMSFASDFSVPTLC
jgi:hypothetical protein